MSQSKVIYSYVYVPSRGEKKTSRPRRTTNLCEMSDKCDLYKQGRCILMKFIGGFCPYGKQTCSEGPTMMAKSFSKWCSDEKEKYVGESERLSSPNDGIYNIGDYVYLNYAHIEFDNHKVPFLRMSTFMTSGRPFLKLEDFNLETIKSIVDNRPEAMMGGEIKDYQNKSVPLFVRHLSEKYPELYKQLIAEYPERMLTEKQLSNIGRKAKISTLRPNIGEFVDIHGGKWAWDGEYLISSNSKASFMLVDSFSELRIKPSEAAGVKVTDDAQVTEETIFID